jgi:hypothetical protein
MISKARTNRLTAAMHGLGSYFYDIPGGGWFGRPDKPAETQQFWRAMGDLQMRIAALGAATAAESLITRHEIALLVDDITPAYFQLSGGPGTSCKVPLTNTQQI